MQKTPRLSLTPSSATTHISGSAKRRSTRIPKRSEEAVSSSDIGNAMEDKSSAKSIDQTNSFGSSSALAEGWKHPAELQYIRRADWSQDLMITYLCQKAFTVPPRQLNTTLSYTEITRSYSGEKINIPRGYRIPLMFVAKFQWESLCLVLNSASEWEEYKFDIIHLSRLCTHFFKQAKSAASENKLTKSWRSPMFDRALIRFYRKWMVSREWSVKKFWEEFEEDEYQLDVLKFDWSRWVLKGHKGFVLTKEEVQNGITADQYRDGLRRKPDGTWMWGGNDLNDKDVTSLDALNSLASQDAVEAITNATPSHDSLEVKQELLELDNESVSLNPYGKRQRVGDGDSPRKLTARQFKKVRTHHKSLETYPRMKIVSNLVLSGIPPLSSGDGRSRNVKGNQQEEDATMEKDPAPLPFSLTDTLKIAPLSHGRKEKVLFPHISHKLGKSPPSPSTTTTMAAAPIDVPSDQTSDLPLIPAPTSTGDPALALAPENPTTKDLIQMNAQTQKRRRDTAGGGGDEGVSYDMDGNVQGTKHWTEGDETKLYTCLMGPGPWDGQLEGECGTNSSDSETEIRGGSIFQVLVPSDARMLDNRILKTIPVPWPTRSLDIATTAQSEAGSSSLAPGNPDVSKVGQKNNPISGTTPIEASGASMQTDNTDPEIAPNVEASEPLTAATMNDLVVDAPLPSQSGILPSSQTTNPSLSTNSTITIPPVTNPPPSSSLPEINLATPPMSGSTKLTPNPNSPSDSSSSRPLVPNSHEGHPDGVDSGNGNRDLKLSAEFRVNLIQSIWDNVQRMAIASQIREPQTTTETGMAEGCELMKAEEERNMVEDSIVIHDSPVLSRSEQLVHPVNLISGGGEVETIVLRAQSVVGEVDAEVSGAGGELTSGEDSTTIVPSESMAMKGEVKAGREDMVEEPEVMDTMDDLGNDTNGVDVRIETCAVEARIAQSRQETPTVQDMAGVDVATEKDAVEVQPVHTQSRQETPTINDTDGVAIPLEVGAVEGQSLNSQSSMETPPAPLNDSKATHPSAVEIVPPHVELQGGNSQEVEVMRAGDLEDKMNVDEEMIQPIQPTAPPPADGNSTSTPFVAPVVRTTSLHSIQLLRGLIHFLRVPVDDRQPRVSRTLEDDLRIIKSQGTCPAVEQAHYPLLAGSRLLTDEAISVDQRLDVLAKVSMTLAKNLYPYRGKELETRIDSLEKNLHQQFEMIQKLDSRFCGEMDEYFKGADAHPDAEFDLDTAAMSILTTSQGVQTSSPFHVNRQFESVEVQTEAENEIPAPLQPLSADATMVDLTMLTPLQEPPSTLAEKGEPQPDNHHSVAKTVMSMMRNMADLLECTTQGTSQGSVRSLKGKEKEVVDVEMMPSYLGSPILTAVLEEFQGVKEEMRRGHRRSQSEVESMRLSHYMEVEALKDEIRNIEGRGKQELDEVTRRYSEEIGELKATIRLREERERERDREKESGSETKSPSLELVEIRRRVASLEARSRSDSDMLRSASRSSMTNGHFLEPVMTRHPNYNPPHLIPTDFEEQPYTNTFRAPRHFMKEGSMSKPGTPVPSDRNHFSNRHADVMDLEESMLLPAKSQRKMHMMNFPRPSMG